MVEAAETNFDLDFSRVTRLALTDLDDRVREIAVEATQAFAKPRTETVAPATAPDGPPVSISLVGPTQPVAPGSATCDIVRFPV